MKILVVEDNKQIAESIGDYLELKGHSIGFAFNGLMAKNVLQEEKFDVIVLDIMMPKLDGLSLTKQLRQEGSQVPILMLTARDALDDKLKGFELGADDYLLKPFAMEELLARIIAITVRGLRNDIGDICVGQLVMNVGENCVQRSGKQLKLNKVQFKLLKKLMQEYPAVVDREILEMEIWGDAPPDSDALRTHIYRLRNTVDKGFDVAMIETVHGKGFRLVDKLNDI